MPQTATFYLLDTKDLESLQEEVLEQETKKGWLTLKRKSEHPLITQLEKLALEKINYRWSPLAFPILAVFSKERLQADWQYLQYAPVADKLSEKIDAGIYIFSTTDTALIKLKTNGYFYSIPQLNQFAAEFEGSKPKNPDLMRNAAKTLEEVLSKLTKTTVALLLLTAD